MNTSILNKIYIHPTASTTKPTKPALGANISSWSGSQAFGSTENATADDITLADDTLEITRARSEEKIQAPRGLAPDDIITLFDRVEEIEFKCADVGEDLLALDSNLAVASNAYQPTMTTTYRAVVIEIQGIGYFYLPRCVVTVMSLGMGYGEGGMAMATVTIKPTKTATYKGGWLYEAYQAA